MSNTSRILLPLDTDTADKAVDLAVRLKDDVAGFKVGLELINAAGFDVFERIYDAAGKDAKIFYDCKFHDIPNTVAGASRAAAKRGVWMFNVHASGGSAMMRAAVQGAAEGAEAGGHARKPLVLAVTILTSIAPEVLSGELGVERPLKDHVVSLARLAQDSGCDGIVASPHEIAAIREACGPDFVLVIPGVRPAGADVGDQKRVMTPGEAVALGADYLVVGRPVYGAPDPSAAARAINAEADAARNNG
ncbi:orotidine 5'-phosphate decarboxylase [Capsulimonas corticalis]|uniref:Orotidine 5'-phosphate decarboxylase n=1 Tax=Capsulimonas corticalis TaxID=2219043 RepID=A0A402CYA5_9BACT|nr:orotidine-5'-phosphate decarboxylase [Capsulimonas corticalis]BDI31435.1 orotidine 5'-phosphate decarboxylase [Capsulimonas corticalis]